MTTTYYLSGPMAGYPEHNFPAFEYAQRVLDSRGYQVISPHLVENDPDDWAGSLRKDLKIMMSACQGLILLRGWPQSRGARLELQTAVALDWPVLYFDETTSQLLDMNKPGSQLIAAPDWRLAITASVIQGQIDWSRETFGPGERTRGVIDHIGKELREVTAQPYDVEEWIDIVILAIDGAWRHGATPEQIIQTYRAKLSANQLREWPDWRTMDEDHAIEHVREPS